ncbi:MAG: EF-hand domain-containing protein, partial [Brevundimonas sp.]|uniref:EF-hand domain-containing protein n=1 Tax=Brevundimonas sp. TaxID=1871086 RepID=UPI00391EF023
MKKTLLAGGLAALTLAAAAGTAFAQQPPARGMRADTDGDRRLSQAEFVGQRVQRLTTADTNRDGSVTADERRVAMQARVADRADARFDRLDGNDDGAVSRAEFDAAREAARQARADRGPRPMRAQRGPARGQRGMPRMEARGPVVIADVQTRAEQAFTRLDADHDGYITPAEGR